MIRFQIAIGVFIIFVIWGIIVFVYGFYKKNEDNKNCCKNTFVSVASIALTMFGIVLAIADDYFSQFDYDKKSVRKYEVWNKRGFLYDSLSMSMKGIQPKYVFVLDVSGSTNDLSFEMNSSIQMQINAINNSGRFEVHEETFGVNRNNNTIRFSDLLKIRLLYSLIQLEKMNYETIDYSIVYFAGLCSKEDHSDGKTLSDCIDISFKNIMDRKFDGQETNFVALFNFINEHILQSPSLRNPFEIKDVNIVFLTDYLHDVLNESSADTKLELEKSIKQLEDANTFLTLFVIENDPVFIQNNNNKRSGLISVYDLFNSYLSESVFNSIDLRNYDYTFDCPVVLSTPFPFFYSNSIFEELLKTKITFDREYDLYFHIRNYSISDKREYRLHQSSKDKPRRLSNNKTMIKVGKKEEIDFEFLGYIPTPYAFPDLVIEDHSKGVKYIIPVVFFKECPKSVILLSDVIIIVLFFGMFMFAVCMFGGNTKKDDSTTDTTGLTEDESPELLIKLL